ncbi:hypothetical protein C0989_000722 [Termitomyces sp. Mn162]|nr:hypothetical protein C0989_000722 [Termitomyces sp. Mn162]
MTAPPCIGAWLNPPYQYYQKKGLQCVKTKGETLCDTCQFVLKKTCSLTRDHKEEVWRNKGKKREKEKRQRKLKSAEYVKEPTTPIAGPSTIQLVDMLAASRKGRGKEQMDLPEASEKGKEQADPLMTSGKKKGKQQADPLILTKSIKAILSQAIVGLNQWLNFINKGIEVVLEEMRSGFVLAEETRFIEMKKMIHLPPAPASTLAPIAEAKEPNNDQAAQPKEDEREMDYATAIATTVDQSAIADNSALISNSVAIMTNSSISSRSTTKSIDCTGPAASITDLAIATDFIISTGPTTIITNSTITTRLAASNESIVPTSVEIVLASPIATTKQLMDVDMTDPAPPHASNEIVPQCSHSPPKPHNPPPNVPGPSVV